jgi:hypothetical protein
MRVFVIALLTALAAPAAAWAGGARLVSQDVPIGDARTLADARPPIRFNLVAVHWRGPGTVLLRTRAEGGAWSRWRAAAPEADDGPDLGSAEWKQARGWRIGNPYWTGSSDRIQYRLRGDVRRLRAYFVWSPPVAIPLRGISVANSPRILSRAAWQANEQIKRASPSYAKAVRLAIVHHTAGSNNYSRAESAAIVRGIELYHVQGNGWNDIAYNFLVDKYGQIFEGRYGGISRNVIGAHAQGFNTGSVGVSLLGTYSQAAPPAAAMTALARLLAWRLDVAHLNPLSTLTFVSGGNPRFPAGAPVFMRAISGHRDVSFTDCPGNALYRRLASIARSVSKLGLPKLYAPTVRGSLGGSVRFGAKLSTSLRWSTTVRDSSGTTVAAGSGTGTSIAWTWDSTLVPRKPYAWAIEAAGVRPARGLLGGRIRQPPAVLLSEVGASPATVTPNDDGRGDFTTIRYRLGAEALVTVTFADAATGTTMATLFREVKTAGPHSFRFTAATLPDGRYNLVVTAEAADGKTATASAPVLVSRLLRSFGVRPSTFSPNGDGRLDRLAFSFELKGPASVRLEARRTGRPATVLYQAELGAGRHRVTWDGSAADRRLPDGRYTGAVRVSDAVASVSLTQPLTIDTTPPRLVLVSAVPLRLRVSEAATLVLTRDGRKSWLRVRPGAVRLDDVLARAWVLAQDVAGNRSRAFRLP